MTLYTSPIEVWRTACFLVGATPPNSDMDTGPIALSLKGLYEPTVQMALSRQAFSFAERSVRLTQQGKSRDIPGWWLYRLPSDLIELRHVSLNGQIYKNYQISAQMLSAPFSSVDGLVLTYVARVPEAQWPADFADVIVQLLGARLEKGPLNRFNQGKAREDEAMERLQSVQARNRSSSGKIARTSDDRLTRAWRGGMSSAFPASGIASAASPTGGPVGFSNELQIVEGKPGRPGRDPQFRATDVALEYRLEGAESWIELFRFSLFNTEPERLNAIEAAITSKADAGNVYSITQVDQALSAQRVAIVGDADDRLNTLGKIALALGGDDSFAANLTAKFGAPEGLATLGEDGKIPETQARATAKPGDMKFSAISGDQDDWLQCDGRVLTEALATALKATALRSALINDGFKYGQVGTDPKIPDMRGRVGAGADDMGASPRANRITNTNLGGNVAHPDGTLGSEGGSDRAVPQAQVVQLASTGVGVYTSLSGQNLGGSGNPNIGLKAIPILQPTLCLIWLIKT